jgi:hypothetical protein
MVLEEMQAEQDAYWRARWLACDGAPEIASSCWFCGYEGNGFRRGRVHSDGVEYFCPCPHCHRSQTRRQGDEHVYYFFPGDIERAFRHA